MVAGMGQRSMKTSPARCRGLALVALAVLLGAAPITARAGQTIALAWPPNAETNIVGYRLFVGTESGNYDTVVDVVAPETSATVTNLQRGYTYYFSLIALADDGQQSDYSVEIYYSVPGGGGNNGGGDNGGGNNGGGDNGGGNNGGGNNGGGGNSGGGGTVKVDPAVFLAYAGSFNGLVVEPDEVRHARSGNFSLKATSRGSYSGKLILGGRPFSVRGLLAADGRGTNVVTGADGASLRVIFSIDGTRAKVDGWVVANSWLTQITGDRLDFDGKTNRAPYAGAYTLTIPCAPGANSPQGYSYGTVRIDTKGGAMFLGVLADGSKTVQKAPLSSTGHWPFYVSLYKGAGSTMGWLLVSRQGDIGGLVSWLKPSVPGRYYAGGLTNEASVVGASYRVPSATELQGAARRTDVLFRGGNLAHTVNDVLMMLPNGQMAAPSSDLVKFSISTATGLFKGTFPDPTTGRPLAFGGVMLQKWETGAGMLLGTNRVAFVGVSLN